MNHKHPNICYFCGMPLDKTTITREHVPPKCFFPKGQKVDLITVPSCKEHNGGKSGDDEYLFLMNSINILANNDGKNITTSKGVKAILRNKKIKQELAKNAQPLYVESLKNGKIEPTFAFSVDFDRIANSIKSIAKGLYFHKFQEVFYGDIVVSNESTIFLDREDDKRNQCLEVLRHTSNEIFSNSTKEGQNPNIFYYQIEQIRENTMIKMCFYGNVSFTASLKTQNNLSKLIREILYQK